MARFKIRNRILTGLKPARNRSTPTSWVRKPVVIHHSASRQPRGKTKRDVIRDEKALIRQFQQGHFNQGWSDIGYHYLITPSGRIFAGRKPKTTGAHAGDNYGNSCPGVCVVGNYDVYEPTEESMAALDWLMSYLERKYKVSGEELPHKKFFPTACPGRFMIRRRKL